MIARLLFALVALAPLVLLQGRPELAPDWLYADVAGIPAVVLLAILWFAMFVIAVWIPTAPRDAP